MTAKKPAAQKPAAKKPAAKTSKAKAPPAPFPLPGAVDPATELPEIDPDKMSLENLEAFKSKIDVYRAGLAARIDARVQKEKQEALLYIADIVKAQGITLEDIAQIDFLKSGNPEQAVKRTATAAEKSRAVSAKAKKAAPSAKAKTAAKKAVSSVKKTASGKYKYPSKNDAPARPPRFFNPATILKIDAPVRDRLWSGLGSRQPAWASKKKPVDEMAAFVKAKNASPEVIADLKSNLALPS